MSYAALQSGAWQLSDQNVREKATLRRQIGWQADIAGPLPPPGLKRWRARDKALVVAAVRHGVMTFNEACARYRLSAEEYLSWRSFDAARPPAAAVADQRN